jgi:hypothetical protein
MKRVFGFFLRLFIAFAAAKLLLGHLGLDTPKYLIGLALLLVLNTYVFDFLEYYHQGAWRRLLAGGKAAGKSEPKDTSPDVAP